MTLDHKLLDSDHPEYIPAALDELADNCGVNAQLMAAAPDLYTRLRESTALLRSALPPDGKDTTRLYGPIEKQIAANEAAMKKAEGE